MPDQTSKDIKSSEDKIKIGAERFVGQYGETMKMLAEDEEWWQKYIDRACRDVTVETSGAYDGEMFRDNFEELTRDIIQEARRRERELVLEELKKMPGSVITEWEKTEILSRLNELKSK